MKLRGFDLQGCVQTSSSVFIFWGLRVTGYHGLQQTSSEIGAFSDTNHKLLLMGVLGASEGLHRTSCCFWLLLRKFCYSVVEDL